MWVNSGIMFLTTFTLCFCFYGLEIQDEVEIIMEQGGVGNRQIDTSNSEISTPPVLKRLGPYFCNS